MPRSCWPNSSRKREAHQGIDRRRIPSPLDSADHASANRVFCPADSKRGPRKRVRSRTSPIPATCSEKLISVSSRLGRRGPNQPRTVYYVMVPERREPATFAALYAPNGDEFRYKMSARQEAGRQLEEQWMGWLRQQAGLEVDLDSARRVQGQVIVRRGMSLLLPCTTPNSGLWCCDCGLATADSSQDDQTNPGDGPGHQKCDAHGVGPCTRRHLNTLSVGARAGAAQARPRAAPSRTRSCRPA